MSRPRRVLLVVAGVLVREGKVLLAKRPPGTAFEGLWELAGGKVEPGETPTEALEREWEEELGVSVLASEPMGFVEYAEPGLHLTLLAFRVTALRGEPSPVAVAGLFWAGPEDARRVAVPPSDRALLDRLLDLSTGGFSDTERPEGRDEPRGHSS